MSLQQYRPQDRPITVWVDSVTAVQGVGMNGCVVVITIAAPLHNGVLWCTAVEGCAAKAIAVQIQIAEQGEARGLTAGEEEKQAATQLYRELESRRSNTRRLYPRGRELGPLSGGLGLAP